MVRKTHQESLEREQDSRIPFQSDLDILRRLSILPGGFSQPNLLYDRLQDLIKPSSDPPTPSFLSPSQQLTDILTSAHCHRKLLWSFVLGTASQSSDLESPEVPHEELLEHRDERQVELDVNRSFVYYPRHISSELKAQLRKILNQTIVRILRKFPTLNYFQGYHDIVTIFLLNFLDLNQHGLSKKSSGILIAKNEGDGQYEEEVADEKLNPDEEPPQNDPRDHDTKNITDQGKLNQDIRLLELAVQKFTLHRIRDSMTSDLSPIMGYLRFTQTILNLENPSFASLISQTSSLPLFSLSWILTLTSHDLTSFDTVSRIFDFLLCHPPVMICYLACAICLSKTKEVDQLIAEAEAEGGAVDLDMVHFIMSSIPKMKMERPLCKSDKIEPSEPAYEDAERNDELGGCSEEEKEINSEQQQSKQVPEEQQTEIDQNRAANNFQEISTATSQNLEIDTVEKEEIEADASDISIEEIIQSTLKLYKTYEPSNPKLKLNKIMGPKSCISTWIESESGRLTDRDAEGILNLPMIQIVKPVPLRPYPRKGYGVSRRLVLFKNKIKSSRIIKKVMNFKQKYKFLFFSASLIVVLIAVNYSPIDEDNRVGMTRIASLLNLPAQAHHFFRKLSLASFSLSSLIGFHLRNS